MRGLRVVPRSFVRFVTCVRVVVATRMHAFVLFFFRFFLLLLFRSPRVRHEVSAKVHFLVFTVAILAQGTNRGDALCAALLSNREVSILHLDMFYF